MTDSGGNIYENPVAISAKREDDQPVKTRKTGGKMYWMQAAIIGSLVLALILFATVIGLHFQQQSEWKKYARALDESNGRVRYLENKTTSTEALAQKHASALDKSNERIRELENRAHSIEVVESCDELRRMHQVTTSGYYLSRNRQNSSPNYIYCDFTEYTDVSTCMNLTIRYNVTMEGYYLFGMTSHEIGRFKFCSPVFQGIYTCQRLQELYAARESGFYKFQSKDMEPFRVYCDFSNNSAVTEVHHNLMGERRSNTTCESPFCYSVNPDYGVAVEDLARIVDNSISCKQFIKLKCRGVQISTHARWRSRTGVAISYWGGASRDGFCACGEIGTCIRKTDKCNCDQNSEKVITSDEGYLTDKSKLPVSQIQLSDMGDFGEESWYTLGKLECSGQS